MLLHRIVQMGATTTDDKYLLLAKVQRGSMCQNTVYDGVFAARVHLAKLGVERDADGTQKARCQAQGSGYSKMSTGTVQQHRRTQTDLKQ